MTKDFGDDIRADTDTNANSDISPDQDYDIADDDGVDLNDATMSKFGWREAGAVSLAGAAAASGVVSDLPENIQSGELELPPAIYQEYTPPSQDPAFDQAYEQFQEGNTPTIIYSPVETEESEPSPLDNERELFNEGMAQWAEDKQQREERDNEIEAINASNRAYEEAGAASSDDDE